MARQKRKAAEAELPDREDTEAELSCEEKSFPALHTEPTDLSGNERLYRFFEHTWSLFIRPEMEKQFGLAPPLPPISLLLSQQLTQMQPLEDIPDPPLAPLTELTHGGGLDEEDSECVSTQPLSFSDCSWSCSDCSCKDCTIAATQTIDQFSDADEE